MSKFLVILLLSFFPLSLVAQSAEKLKISDDLQLVKIAPSAYVHVSYTDVKDYGRVPANGMVLIHGSEVFLFDTPWNNKQTKELLQYLQQVLHLKVSGCILSDWHEDSMGGLAVLHAESIPTYANELTRKIEKEKGLPASRIGFTDSLSIPFGQENLFCYYPGAGHTLDNIVVWVPEEKIIFGSCLIKEKNAQNLGFTGDGDTNAYAATLIKLQHRFSQAMIVIPGHGDCGRMDLVEHTLELAKRQK